MSEHTTAIQWTHVPGYKGETWNPTTGCTRVSPGCDHCYAFQLHDQRHVAWKRGRMPNAPAQYHEPFSTVQLLEARLTEPLRARKPRAYFVDSMADLFHEDVPDGYLWAVFDVMRRSPQHIFMILTKRVDRMRDFVSRWCDLSGEASEPKLVRGPQATRETHPSGRGQLFAEYLDWLARDTGGEPPPGAAWPTFDWMEGPRWASWWWPNTPLPNVWLGVSAEDQARADERVPVLLDTPAAVRFVSAEPLLGPISFSSPNDSRLDRFVWLEGEPGRPPLDWVIVGGESGQHARPFDLAWARSIRDQCAASGVAFFMKQLGQGALVTPVADFPIQRRGHNGDPELWPADLRVREWPRRGGA